MSILLHPSTFHAVSAPPRPRRVGSEFRRLSNPSLHDDWSAISFIPPHLSLQPSLSLSPPALRAPAHTLSSPAAFHCSREKRYPLRFRPTDVEPSCYAFNLHGTVSRERGGVVLGDFNTRPALCDLRTITIVNMLSIVMNAVGFATDTAGNVVSCRDGLMVRRGNRCV